MTSRFYMVRPLLLSLVLLLSSTSLADVFINETAPPGEQWAHHWHEPSQAAIVTRYRDTERLKSQKKVGISTTVGGAMGLIGMSLDLNFTPETAFAIGSGMSQGFTTLNMYIKTDLTRGAFQVYFVGGLARWFSNSRHASLKNSEPSFLYTKFLTPHERQTGIFAKNIAYPGLGIQLTDLNGSLAGLGFFTEVLALTELSTLRVVPAAALGAVYYF